MIQNRTADRQAGGLARVDEDGLLDVKQGLLVMCVCWVRDCNSHTVLYVCSCERGGQVDCVMKAEKRTEKER